MTGSDEPWWRKVRGSEAPASPLSPAAVWALRLSAAVTVLVAAVLVVATASLLPVFLLAVPAVIFARLPRPHRRQVFGGRPT